jgi:hypothetical protein
LVRFPLRNGNNKYKEAGNKRRFWVIRYKKVRYSNFFNLRPCRFLWIVFNRSNNVQRRPPNSYLK